MFGVISCAVCGRMWRWSQRARLAAGAALALALALGAARRPADITLWIDERQVRMFSGNCILTVCIQFTRTLGSKRTLRIRTYSNFTFA